MLATFLQCRQKARYDLDGWESVLKGTTFDYGELFHRLLQTYYGSKKIGDEMYATTCFEEVTKAWMEDLKKAGPINAEYTDELQGILAGVWRTYWAHWSKHDKKIEWKFLEKVFDVKWKGFRLRGKIDGIFMSGGKYWILETKTKSQVEADDNISDLLLMDLQNQYYLTALAADGIDAVGVLYNIIRKPQLKKKEATVWEFADRIAADAASRPEHYFKRFEVTYPKESLKRFQTDLIHKLTERQQWLDGAVPTYRNETSCFARGYCTYLRACATGQMIGYEQTRKLFRELT